MNDLTIVVLGALIMVIVFALIVNAYTGVVVAEREFIEVEARHVAFTALRAARKDVRELEAYRAELQAKKERLLIERREIKARITGYAARIAELRAN